MSDHLLTLYSPTGEFLSYLRWKSIDVTLVERGIGVLTIALFPEHSDAIFQRDCRIAYTRTPKWRRVETGKLVGDTVWLLSGRERTFNGDTGQHSIVLTCQHPNAILGRRVVAYNEGTSQADKSDTASDVLYDYINENFVAATDTDRNLSTTHFVLDPRPAPTFGPTLDIAGSYRSILDILEDATQSAAAQSSYIGYEVYVQSAPGPFRLRFYRTVRGADRGLSSNQPLLITPQYAHATGANVHEDWSTAVSFVYAGGSGEQDERAVQTQEDTTLSAQSPFGRFERFTSVSTADTAVLTSEAYKTLRDYRPRRGFASTLAPDVDEYSTAMYDVDYSWGDIVGAQFAAPVYSGEVLTSWITYKFDCRVNPVHLQVVRTFDENQYVIDTKETIEAHLQSVESAE